MSTILVLGANGNVGAPLVRSLLDAGHSVRAAGRSGQAPEGAEPVAFDYTDPAAIDRAFDGADAAYVLLPAGTVAVRELLLPVIEAAQRHKVKVVLQTALGVDADESIPFRQVERALEASGLPFVILRPNWFADNFHTYWKAGIDHGVIAVPAADGRTSFIDARDIAASAAAALTSDRFDGQAFNLIAVPGTIDGKTVVPSSPDLVEPNTNRDTVPREVWEDVKSVISDKGMTHREFASAMGTSTVRSWAWCM